ncbi:hypothetical protein ACQP2P_20165 [Dactylosporangium sp. CA-139114]|uniref:hypothetical protein n=1 Tax=Dactylosporangium sp. CA-139114 TaxID=3239931 RepID=UPI003D960832
MIEQSLVIGARGTNIVRPRDALALYVYAERRNHGLHFWIYFEDRAARTAARHPETVYAALGLRSRPPRPQPDDGRARTAPDGGADPCRNRRPERSSKPAIRT